MSSHEEGMTDFDQRVGDHAFVTVLLVRSDATTKEHLGKKAFNWELAYTLRGLVHYLPGGSMVACRRALEK